MTGATFSSRAAQETIRERLAEAAALPPPVRPSIRWNRTDAAVILLLLGNLYWFFRPLRGRYRQIQLTANLFLLGFLAHGGLSLAQVAGWVRSSPHWTLSVPLLLFSAVILLALARGKNFYCSGVCPFGCAQELTAKLGRAVGVPQRPGAFRFGPRLRRIVLGATVLALVCGIPFLPYEPFPAFAPGASWWMILSAFLLVALSLFRPRLWCRWFCSCGALLDFFCRTDLKPKPLDGGTKMNFERVVILALLLLLALALIRPGGAAASGGGTPVEPERRPDVLEVIHSRKSVRAYTKEPVTLPELETLVRAGFAAPTGANAQPWAFIIVTDRAKLDALAEVMPYGKMLKSAPGAVVVCGVSSQFRTGEAREMWVQDCSAATENILLAAEGTGLGAVWLGVFPYRERSAGVASVLGLPDDIIPFSIVSVGRPTRRGEAEGQIQAGTDFPAAVGPAVSGEVRDAEDVSSASRSGLRPQRRPPCGRSMMIRPLNDGRSRRAVEPRPAAMMARRRWRAPVRRRRRRHRPAWARAQHLHDSADDGPGDLYAVAQSPVPCFGPERPGGKHSRQQHDFQALVHIGCSCLNGCLVPYPIGLHRI